MQILRAWAISLILLVWPATTSADPSWTKALIESAPVYLKANPGTATEHAHAAIFASTLTGVDAEILLGMAYVESRFYRRVVSRKECRAGVCQRKGGFWRSHKKPWYFRGPYFCGSLQTGGKISWAACQHRMANLPFAYLEAALHLNKWRAQSICARRRTADARLRCAMLGYGGGHKLIALADSGYRAGSTTYPVRCLRFAKRLRQALQRTPRNAF